MNNLLSESKKWGNLGIPIKDVGNKIEQLNESLEKHKMGIEQTNTEFHGTHYDIETSFLNGEEKATAINLRVLLFDGGEN